MEAKHISIILILLFSTAGIGAFTRDKGAASAAASIPSDTFYYYPKVNVYYDIARSLYIFPSADGASWQYAKSIEERFTAGLGKRAVIANPALPVWKSNEHHRLVYSAALYAAATDFRKAQPKQPTAGKAAVAPKKSAEKKKKETGVQRFFKRLFGKKSSE